MGQRVTNEQAERIKNLCEKMKSPYDSKSCYGCRYDNDKYETCPATWESTNLAFDLLDSRALLKEALEYIDGAIEFHESGYTYREPNRAGHEAILAKLREAIG